MTLQKNLIKTAQANKLHKKANFLAFSAFIFALFLSFFMALHSQAVLAADEAVAPALPPSQGSVPDAGRIMQEIERDQNAKPPQALPEIEDSEPGALPDAEEASVVIRQFKFQGNKVVSSEALSQALVSITNHEVTITQLKASVDLISEHYRKQGYLAIATLPDQDITDGEVTVLITEAVFGGVGDGDGLFHIVIGDDRQHRPENLARHRLDPADAQHGRGQAKPAKRIVFLQLQGTGHRHQRCLRLAAHQRSGQLAIAANLVDGPALLAGVIFLRRTLNHGPPPTRPPPPVKGPA